MCIMTSICMWLFLVNTFVQKPQIRADEYLPRRLEAKIVRTPDSAYLQSQSKPHSRKGDYFSGPVPCSILCFLKPPDYEIITCSTKTDEFEKAHGADYKQIKCQQTKGGGEIIVGSKESVRGIEPGALGTLLHSEEDGTPTSGHLSIHLNINMVRLDAKVFQGLETVVTEVRLLNVVRMHPDSLVELGHLRVFEIESGQTPTLISNENKRITNTSRSGTQVASDQPAYIRLLTVDTGVPISFNFETTCHRCKLDNFTEDDYVIVSFKKPPEFRSTSELSRHSSFSMIFPQTCPRIDYGVGCNGGTLESGTSSDDSGKTMERGKQLAFKEAKHIVQESYPPSMLILLGIWCTLLTLMTILIIGFMYFCIRRISSHKPPPRWLSIICANQPSSLEEISSSSTNSEFYRKTPNIGDRDSGMLTNPLMNESGISWNSLQIGPRMFKSEHNLKERGGRVQRCYAAVTGRRNYRTEQNRRSIGSQTDFTDIDSELVIYSSLRRAAMPLQFSSFLDPPTRTTSQYALGRTRQPHQLDYINQRVEQRKKLSFSGLDSTTSHPKCGDAQLQNFADMVSACEKINCQSCLSSSHPPVFNLPPVAPTSRTTGHPPAAKTKLVLGN